MHPVVRTDITQGWSQLTCCLSGYVCMSGIDIVSVHPSPVMSRFYDKTHKMEMLDMVRKNTFYRCVDSVARTGGR